MPYAQELFTHLAWYWVKISDREVSKYCLDISGGLIDQVYFENSLAR
ncbi:hypothetical protein H6G33_00265 [Calothrix sp. FACHB-1219]|nr:MULTISPECIES: hypothetical protein [unclassified Calothrix]MBD2201036.1 hypothetical protein [Calothrix sp. FACHB-168]MBD2215469.1 hypothetical protein [Calothrix sp. FACHB-1219]